MTERSTPQWARHSIYDGPRPTLRVDRVGNFFIRIFQAVGHGLGRAVSFVLSPFRWFTGWYGRRGGILKAVLGALLLVLVAFYLYFFRSTQRWTNFDPNYAARYTTPAEPVATGDRPAGGIVSTTEEAGAQAAQTCRRSQIVDATADLVDFNVNQNRRPGISHLAFFSAPTLKAREVAHRRARRQSSRLRRPYRQRYRRDLLLRDRSEKYNSGWFDPRADDRFWFAYGQLYGYYGILTAAPADFRDVIAQRGLTQLWTELEDQLRASLRIQPMIISNGDESGWLMPAHLATLGFYILRVRSNLVA